MTQEELMAMMSGPTYDSTGADDDEKSLADLRAQRGDARLEAPEPPKDPEPAKEPEPEPAKEPEKDPEPAKDPEPEPAKDSAPEPAKEPEPKEHMIPKSRYDSLRARMDQLEAKVQQTEPKKDQIDPVKDIDAKLAAIDEPMHKALADGDMAKYRELRTQERDLYSQRSEAIAERKASSVTSTTIDEQNFLRSVGLLEQNFPALDTKSESFDEGLTNQVTELVEAYIAMGNTKTDALRKAVNVMEGQIRATLPKAKEPEPAKDPEPDPAIAAAKEAERKAAAVKKGVEAAKAQPATTGKQGQDADKQGIKGGIPNPNSMTDDELDALPAETLKRMRGDFRANVRA